MMRAFTVFSAFVAVAFSGVLATPGTSPAALLARQNSAIPDIPPACQAQCATIQKITSCGTDLACMCTNEMGQGIVDCGNCGINYNKNDPNINTYKAQFQAAVNAYADSCTQAGHPIGPFSVTGGTSSSGGSSGTSGTSSSSASSPSGSATSGTSGNSGTSGGSSNSNDAASTRAMTGAGALAGIVVVMAALL